jgi:hypothetical protein
MYTSFLIFPNRSTKTIGEKKGERRRRRKRKRKEKKKKKMEAKYGKKIKIDNII